MKVVVIGAVAAGTTAAAKIRRNDPDAEIIVYERDQDISYGICGIPYYIGGEIKEVEELTPRDAGWFKDKYNIVVKTGHEVTRVDATGKKVTVKDLKADTVKEDKYDFLILATGASPFIPSIKGIDREGVFPVRTIQDSRDIAAYIDNIEPRQAIVIGGGYIGLEMTEQLKRKGMEVTVVQRGPRVMSILDKELTDKIEEHLKEKGIKVVVNETVTEIEEGKESVFTVRTDKGSEINADIVISAAGIRPNTELAAEIGLEIGATKAVSVNKKMQTSVPGIYAVGDVAESFSIVTGKPIYRPLGSTANKMGRIAADAITGGDLRHRGILGTSIVRIFDLEVAQTGLTEKEAVQDDFDVQVVELEKRSKPAYMDGKKMFIKAAIDRKSNRLLGAQIVGEEGVDKRIDVLATAIFFGADAEDLFHLDLAYAPPFSSPKDPVHYIGMISGKKDNNHSDQ